MTKATVRSDGDCDFFGKIADNSYSSFHRYITCFIPKMQTSKTY